MFSTSVELSNGESRDTAFTGTVTVSLVTNPGAATLGGTLSVNAIAGLATFSNLTLDQPGVGYQLTFVSSGLPDGFSDTFNITAASATHLAVTLQPTDTAVMTEIAATATARNASEGDDNDYSGTVTVTLGNNPSGATLTGTTSITASNGVFGTSDLMLDKPGIGYTLIFTSPDLGTVETNPFDIVAGPATQLAFSTQPSDVAANASITPAIVVRALDAGGNLDTSFAGTVTLTINGKTLATLSGGTATASGGIATFSNAAIDLDGMYELVASSTGLTDATSNGFTVGPAPATKLVFAQEPTNATAGVNIAPTIVVNATDVAGNIDSNYTGSVTLAVATGPGVLSGTMTTVNAIAGVASFPGVNIQQAGMYTLTATASGLTSAGSASFTISPAAFAGLSFVVQPTDQTAGPAITPAIQVSSHDAFNNPTPAYTGTVTLSIMTGPATATLSGTLAQNAVAGVATFANISLDKAGTYSLRADSAGRNTQSANFNITASGATTIGFSVQPTDTVAGVSITPAVQVTGFDAFGNVATTFTDAVTLSAGVDTLSGTTTVNAVAGVATFSNLSIAVAGPHSLTALAEVDSATSNTFNITAGAASALAVAVQPTNVVAGAAITPAITVRAVDSSGNTNTSFVGGVTVSIATGPVGAVLSGTVTVNAVAGVATFSTLTLDLAGTYTLQLAAGGLTSTTSNSFVVSAGTAAQLAFAQQPTSATAGSAIVPAVLVEARDTHGNVSLFTGPVTIALATNPGSVVAGGTLTVNAVAGVATFADLHVDTVGAGYQLVATSGALTSATSSAFAISPGPAVVLVFATSPSSVAAGAAITPAITIAAHDAQGNVATSFTGSVSLSLGANPGLSTLGGTLTQTAAAGVATFSNITLDKVGTGYTLVAEAPLLPSLTSSPFDVTPAAAAALVFSVQPTTSAAGTAITPALIIDVHDASGNLATPFTGPVTIAIGTNPAAGTLGGTATVNAVAGRATFSTLTIDLAGTGYTLAASSTGLTGVTSNAFDIVAADANHLVIDVGPSDAVAGADIAPAIVITAHDMNGNLDTTFTGTVTLALSANPSSATLLGTSSATAVAGQVTFANLALDKVGTGYTLTASSTGVVSSTSGAFAITPAAVDHLVFGQQPADGVAGAALATVRVDAFDAFENLATQFTGPIAIALGTNTPGATLGGTATVNAVAGRASFTTLTVDKTGTGYTLVASGASVPSATSDPFAITPGGASAVAFTVQPSSIAAGAFITPAIQVEVRDAAGNRATSFTGAVTLAIGTNPGTSTLSGATTANAVAGVATFANVTLDKVGTGYTLVASGTGLTMATSTAFNVTPGAATNLAFTVQPSDAVANTAIAPPITVTVRDASNNVVTSFTGNVTVALTNAAGATLAGTTTVAAVAGVATFSTLAVDKAGTGYQLAATATGVTSATSDPFAITPGATTALVVVQQPTNGTAGMALTPALQIGAVDASNNRVTSFTGAVTIAFGTNPTSATLGGTLTVNAVAGVASFSTLTVDRAGTGYTLHATSGALTPVNTNAFDIVASTTTHLAIAVQPTDVAAGSSIAPAVVVQALDAQNNPVTSFTGSVTIAIGTNANGATLMGTAIVNAVAGVATFSNLSLDKAGTGYTLAVSSGGLTGATSTPFDVTPGAVAAYTANLAANVNATEVVALSFTAVDSFGNTVTGYTGSPAITSSDAASAHPATVTFAAGVASASITFNTPGAQTVTLTDGAIATTFTTNVVAGGDMTMTTVKIVSPEQGDPVGNLVTIRVEGTLATGTTLRSFEVLVDGVGIGTADALPAEVLWDTSALTAPATHVITARLTDSAGTTVESEVTVSIDVVDNGFGCAASNGHGTAVLIAIALFALTRRRRRR
jgi:hypothetical protein